MNMSRNRMTDTQECKPRMFLALTALEEFWDTARPILFLGEWCKVHSRKHIWKGLNSTVLQSPELSYADSYEAYQYAMGVYEKLLPKLADWLNEFHGTQYSLKYWKLLVGPFLFWYTQVIYQRFLYLQAAYHENPDLETYGLSSSSFFTPMNTNEFVCHAWNSDGLNFQIFTQLLDLAFKRPVDYKEITWEAELKQRKMNFCEVSYKVSTKFLLFCLRSLNKLERSQTVGLLDGFDKQDMFRLMTKSGFRILPLLPINPINRGQTLSRSLISENIINMEKRNGLLTIPAEEELSRLVIRTLPVNMPINFIESYQEEVNASKKYFPYVCKLIMVESCASYDQYKYWIGEQLERGAKLVGYQHGGCYGMQKASSAEFLECQTSDFFISWGWGPYRNVLPAPMTHAHKLFKKYFRKGINEKYDEILWVATISHYRYQLTIHSWSILSKPYLIDQKKFFNKLDEKISSQIIMRLNPSSPNLDEIQEYLPGLNIHSPESRDSFFTQLDRAKIVVIDNASTTFLYTLAFNVPTILFWDKEYWVFRDEAKPYLEALEQVGIYYDSPEGAAKMLNKIADDPLPWWNNEAVQLARRQFCDRFARMSSNYLREWKDLLLGLSKPIHIEDEVNDVVL